MDCKIVKGPNGPLGLGRAGREGWAIDKYEEYLENIKPKLNKSRQNIGLKAAVLD